MSMKVRALLSFVLVFSAMWLSGCGHYICHTTLGASTCTPSGGGLSSGGGGGSNLSQTAFVYFIDYGVASPMAAEGLNFADSQTYAPISSFVSPNFPNGMGAPGGMVIVDKKYLYMPFQSGELFSFSIDAATSDLTQIGSSYIAPSGTYSAVVAD